MNESFADKIAAHLQDFVNAQCNEITEEDMSVGLSPLHIRVKKLLDQMPQSTQQAGVSLLQLQACLRGRKGGLPHIGELGAAVRSLGWQRRRAWSDETTSFSSKWYPADKIQTYNND
jgi:hypothetical protein